MRIFFAGIVQGSHTDGGIVDQSYRAEIAEILDEHLSNVEIIDPVEMNPGREDYSDEQAMQAMHELGEWAGKSDVLIAYLPSASMGAAIEIWHAHLHNVPIYSISPMADNWMVAAFAEKVFPDIATFKAFIADGGFDHIKTKA